MRRVYQELYFLQDTGGHGWLRQPCPPVHNRLTEVNRIRMINRYPVGGLSDTQNYPDKQLCVCARQICTSICRWQDCCACRPESFHRLSGVTNDMTKKKGRACRRALVYFVILRQHTKNRPAHRAGVFSFWWGGNSTSGITPPPH